MSARKRVRAFLKVYEQSFPAPPYKGAIKVLPRKDQETQILWAADLQTLLQSERTARKVARRAIHQKLEVIRQNRRNPLQQDVERLQAENAALRKALANPESAAARLNTQAETIAKQAEQLREERSRRAKDLALVERQLDDAHARAKSLAERVRTQAGTIEQQDAKVRALTAERDREKANATRLAKKVDELQLEKDQIREVAINQREEKVKAQRAWRETLVRAEKAEALLLIAEQKAEGRTATGRTRKEGPEDVVRDAVTDLLQFLHGGKK